MAPKYLPKMGAARIGHVLQEEDQAGEEETQGHGSGLRRPANAMTNQLVKHRTPPRQNKPEIDFKQRFRVAAAQEQERFKNKYERNGIAFGRPQGRAILQRGL